MPETDPAWSELAVAQVRQQSRLVASHSVQPLKIINPTAPASPACHAVLASYGGGLVAGDSIRLRVRCEAGSRLLLTTQANTRIFKSIDGSRAEQLTEGHVAGQALAVVLPDPLVPQAASRYHQAQHWHLAESATLLLADWWHAGRTDLGEKFAFTSFATELRVSVAGRLALLDRFALQPAGHLAASQATFGPYQSALSLYLVGPPGGVPYQRLAAALRQLPPPGQTELHASLAGRPHVVAVTQARPHVLLVRALGMSRLALEPVYQAVAAALAGEELLGFNPLARKY
ncbi:urease accessory protein UreD [Hymenobacter cheonanensis]|uniref:urease accessory protein UreD n=1 Tax=Hymenobacter sp. CA2-7 TaxID=3063993 RepID=UPI002713AAF4|nr:urease accessory protein UreD [Hymenobacter sp. CA2-7]MDO7886550.1 urease accessory protein UreD [Hymenobacter sp. CA2-7]